MNALTLINAMTVGTLLAQRMLAMIEQLRPYLKEIKSAAEDVPPEVLDQAIKTLEEEIKRGMLMHQNLVSGDATK